MILLNVPYEEKDLAKSLGAKWNPELKKWYIQNTEDAGKFAKWIWKSPENYETLYIFSKHIYIVEGMRVCHKCGKKTRVIGLGVEQYYQIYDDEGKGDYTIEKVDDNDISISEITEDLPKSIIDYCSNIWNFKKTFSKTVQHSYLANCCDHCNALQGNYFLFEEVDSPFTFFDKIKAEKLKLHEIKLRSDIPIYNYSEPYDSSNEFIKIYSKKDFIMEL